MAVISLLLILLLPLPASADGTFQATSGAHKVAVLELYTSEGCSSCPPAERFVSQLAEAGFYPRRVIPLAFHVTYWDYLGWQDPYAQEAFDERQYRVAERHSRRGVYTPQLLLDGAGLRGTGGFGERLRAVNAQLPAARISVSGHAVAARLQLGIDVRITEAQRRANAALYVALVESGLVSSVSAGENRGRKLVHDHVVRRLVGPLALASGRPDSHHALTLERPAAADSVPASLVAFVQDGETGEVLQALAIPLADAPPAAD